MKLIRYPQYNPLPINSVITIGHFDGVHIGHQKLIEKVKNVSLKENLSSVVVSMLPLASQFFLGREKVPVITPFRKKFQLFKSTGIDSLCLLNFNKNLAELSAKDFVDNIILKGLKAKSIIVGDDFRFGKGREGDFHFLKSYCGDHGVKVEAVDSVLLGNQRVSSSLIRENLTEGDFKQVEKLLGRSFTMLGKVRKGQQLGRKLGYPTLNIKIKNYKSPVNGIFCVSVRFENGETYKGSASLGTRPTVNGQGELLEVYLFDFSKQVYGENVEVLFHHKIRNEVKFNTLTELQAKINDDVIKTKEYFNLKQFK